MPAHTRSITPPKCSKCGGPATVKVFNNQNAEIGTYCARHGRELVETLNKRP